MDGSTVSSASQKNCKSSLSSSFKNISFAILGGLFGWAQNSCATAVAIKAKACFMLSDNFKTVILKGKTSL
jgi:hypothetical protein